ncbi:MAG: hypothetical protein C0423_14770 [Methylibium sp.]|nr:hypothetical protein [Methylibium sp.]
MANVTLMSSIAAAQPPVPRPVAKALAEMDLMCRNMAGKPANGPDLLRMIDLNGDSLPDYVLDQGSYVCDGAASAFSGTAGSLLTVWVSSAPGGQVRKAFDGYHYGVKVDLEHKPQPQLVLALSGVQCGQKFTPLSSNAEMQACWRPLNWDAKRRTLLLAPLSDVRPYKP